MNPRFEMMWAQEILKKSSQADSEARQEQAERKSVSDSEKAKWFGPWTVMLLNRAAEALRGSRTEAHPRDNHRSTRWGVPNRINN